MKLRRPILPGSLLALLLSGSFCLLLANLPDLHLHHLRLHLQPLRWQKTHCPSPSIAGIQSTPPHKGQDKEKS